METAVVTTGEAEEVVAWRPRDEEVGVPHFEAGPAAGAEEVVSSEVVASERWEASTTRGRRRNATLMETGGLSPLRSNLSTTHSGTRILMASNGVKTFSLCCQSRK